MENKHQSLRGKQAIKRFCMKSQGENELFRIDWEFQKVSLLNDSFLIVIERAMFVIQG